MLQTTTTYFKFPELEAEINASLKSASERVTNDTTHLASQKLPGNQTETFSAYWREHHSRFQEILGHINQVLKRNSSVYEMNESNQACNEEQQVMNNDLKEQKDRLADHMTNPPHPPKKNTGYFKGAAFLISILEGIYAVPALKSLGLSPIAAWVMAAVFGICLAFFFRLLSTSLRRSRSHVKKALLGFGAFILLAAVYFILGTMRAEYLSELAHAEGLDIEYSPWPFFILSMFFSLVAFWVTNYDEPTEEEQAQANRYNNWNVSKQKLESEITGLNDRLKSLKQSTIQNSARVAERIEYGRCLELRVAETAYNTFERFKKQNLSHRTDGPGNLSVGEPYPGQFDFQFQYKTDKP